MASQGTLSFSSVEDALREPCTDGRQVRLQTRAPNGPKGMFGTFVHILKQDGFLGLYSGLSASLLRQLTYSTTRFGVYEELKEVFTTSVTSPSFPTLIAMASTSGFLGGVAGNPADVLNVRMQHDAALPAADRRNYKNAIDGLIRMTREEGWRSLFRGVWPNSVRAVLMTASQLASYDGFKRVLLTNTGMDDNLTTHFTASFLAGFVATTVCSPVDVIKTRIMSAKESEGLAKLLVRIYKLEGVSWMFRGWVPSFIRLGPHTVVTFIFLEQHKKMYRHLKGFED
ncbi:Mitochondrial dicarboxylate transporter [Lignoscripta atroalba]|nr:Mitochondrial dicarboxylate transporter [Lignoscripta atroalba]